MVMEKFSVKTLQLHICLICLFNIHLDFFQPTYCSSIECDALPLRSIPPDTSKFKSVPQCNILSSGEILLTLCKFKLPLQLYIHTVTLRLCCRKLGLTMSEKNAFCKLYVLGKKRVFKLRFYVPVTWEVFTAHRFSFPIQSCQCRANIFLSLQTLAVRLTGVFCLVGWLVLVFVGFFLCELLLKIKKATHFKAF